MAPRRRAEGAVPAGRGLGLPPGARGGRGGRARGRFGAAEAGRVVSPAASLLSAEPGEDSEGVSSLPVAAPLRAFSSFSPLDA